MPEEHRVLRLQESADELASAQEAFSRRHRLRLYGEVRSETQGLRGSEAICHNKIVEDVALPGQIVVGTDSHTCTAGVLGCLAFGVGSTDMANAWRTRDVRVTVPRSVRIELSGRLSPLTCAKDLMLHLLSQEYFKSGRGLGQVLEFAGDGLAHLSIDERATLTNMAVEAGGFTGIMEPDERVVSYLFETRGIEPEHLADRLLYSDRGAEYAARLSLDLGQVTPMVATPGDPKNGTSLSELTKRREIPIDIAYAGSCTGGKMSDMDMYARVLGDALSRGQRVSERVMLFIQFGSQNVRRYAESRGYVKLFEAVGAKLLDPSCGACIAAGPGVSTRKDQVTVSAINRNYPGRSGPGQVYLASPLVVAASAIAGKIQAPTIETGS
jgi:3-isopropylmalate/(R)-2-methylmalate dehydratase large subunit